MLREINQVNRNSNGTFMKIVGIENNNVIVEFQDEYKHKVKTKYDLFKRGCIKNPYDKTIYNKGFIGVGKHSRKDDNVIKYEHWRCMIRRCYGNVMYNSYIGCSIYEKWFNFQVFGDWFEENYYIIENEKMCLDKDIIGKNSKIYSPDTCIFVPEKINNLFISCHKENRELPIGVNKTGNKYRAKTLNEYGKKDDYCTYDDPIEAFHAYKKYKENKIKNIADLYKYRVPKKVYDALYSYEVNIND